MNSQQKYYSKIYLIYKLLCSMWFVGAIWLYFYRIFISDQQVGLLDGMAFAIGLAAEVPSGALADKYGHGKLVKIGQILTGIGILIQATGSSFLPFFTGQAILMIGISFVSGADEALFFEKLRFKQSSNDWRKLVMRGSQAGLIGSLIAVISGGFLYTIDPRLPWFLTGIVFLIAALIIFPITDRVTKHTTLSFSNEFINYLKSIQSGFLHFTRSSLWRYIPIILIVQGLFYTTGWGLLRLVLLDRFNFTPTLGSFVIAFCTIFSALTLGFLHRYTEKISEKKVITCISIVAGISLLISVADIGMWGFFVILALHAGEHTLYPYMSEILNKHAIPAQRATILSVASFMRTLPYVFLGPLIGKLNTQGNLEYFLYGWLMLVFVALAIYLGNTSKNIIVSVKA